MIFFGTLYLHAVKQTVVERGWKASQPAIREQELTAGQGSQGVEGARGGPARLRLPHTLGRTLIQTENKSGKPIG
jgi:hypothetical protein